MGEELMIIIPEFVQNALDTLEKAGFEGYLVGGCVRDFAMGLLPHDYDIAVSSLPSETIDVFRDYRVIETGIAHGTVTVMADGNPLEMTTFRTDGKYSDNRHPESVSFTGNIRDDLSRRDFTVNAMAYNPKIGFIDLFGGLSDIRKRVIKCVGEPLKRFDEDVLRILRALRFASVLGFEIDEKTAEGIHEKKMFLKEISAERINAELTKLLCGVRVSDILKSFADVFTVFAPNVDYTSAAQSVQRIQSEPLLRLSALLSECSKESANDFLRRLRYDNTTKKLVILLIYAVKENAPVGRIPTKRFISEHGYEFTFMYSELKKAVCPTFDKEGFIWSVNQIKAENPCLTLQQLSVNGKALANVGIPEGAVLGRILNELLKLVVDEKISNTEKVLLDKAKLMYESKS